jgi:hypothetical protein
MTNEELDQARAEKAFEQSKAGDLFTDIAAHAARLAREGWTPPVPVDPDLAEAKRLVRLPGRDGLDELALAGIKRGRALAAAEAAPGMVWVKHDGSARGPFIEDDYVWLKNKHGTFISYAKYVFWEFVTHYAIITQPEEK